MTQAVKHVYVSKAQSKLVLSSLAFSRCSFSKTERNGTRQDSSGGVEKRVGSGRVGSGRVKAVLYPSRPKPHSFFAPPWLSRR